MTKTRLMKAFMDGWYVGVSAAKRECIIGRFGEELEAYELGKASGRGANARASIEALKYFGVDCGEGEVDDDEC